MIHERDAMVELGETKRGVYVVSSSIDVAGVFSTDVDAKSLAKKLNTSPNCEGAYEVDLFYIDRRIDEDQWTKWGLKLEYDSGLWCVQHHSWSEVVMCSKPCVRSWVDYDSKNETARVFSWVSEEEVKRFATWWCSMQNEVVAVTEPVVLIESMPPIFASGVRPFFVALVTLSPNGERWFSSILINESHWKTQALVHGAGDTGLTQGVIKPTKGSRSTFVWSVKSQADANDIAKDFAAELTHDRISNDA